MKKKDIQNTVLANEIISRLNEMISKDESVRQALSLLTQYRVELPDEALRNHSTIQVGSVGSDEHVGAVDLGFLGMLNGIVGVIPDGERKGWGYVMAVVDRDGTIGRFVNTQDSVKAST
ncbi:MAG: hypothetical protein IH897_09745 [Planctomycetes bacterium]|nr:hypothetical protein [Planctomycetota bacterium]